jgi:Alr-MurF fusion protein
MPLYTCENIASEVDGELLSSANKDLIKNILTDSRKFSSASGTVFFAIKGDRNDGHNYIDNLYEKGVRAFVVSYLPNAISFYPEASFIKVVSVLAALQKLASEHRKGFDLPVVAITGSNGKTIVKEWLFQLLREDKNIVRSPKSYNSQIGVPLSVWQISHDHELAIFEAGISKPGEMQVLKEIIKPDIGIFTNIGEAHSENFSGISEKVAEKAKLFEETKKIIFCKDYQSIEEQLRNNPALKDVELFTWSKKAKADMQIGKIAKDKGETEINAVYKFDFIKIRIPFTDDASIENAIHCWALMLLLGYDNSLITKRMALLSPVEMRLELKEGINNCSIINDSYNSDLGSLSIALDFLNQQKQHEKKTLILSDILQSGKDEVKLYKEVSEMLKNKGVVKLIGIGEAISRQAEVFDAEKKFYLSTSDFLNEFKQSEFHNEVILLKGARLFGFEHISKVLQQKSHETVLEIDLNALVHNLNYFRARLKPETKIMVMVKAFSYGSGSYEIASVLQFHKVDYLTVAYADEGIELRKAGITMPIMVMNPEEQSFDSIIKNNLEPEIYSFRIFNQFTEALKRNMKLLEKPFPVHLKLDTGMKRLGFEEDDLNELVIRIRNNKNLQIQSVFSHLASSDENIHDEFTNFQIEKFIRMSKIITDYLDYPVIRHILNSAGIIRFPEAQFDMVRLGVGLYGIGANEYEHNRLQNVSTLKTAISQIKNVRPGESIGYGRKATATNEMQIATVPIGYADGLSRKLSNRKGKMLVNNKFAEIVGNVCMDMCMLDITGIQAKEGDRVVVFGEQPSILDVAQAMETIPYEVLTNVSRRVKRVYFQE